MNAITILYSFLKTPAATFEVKTKTTFSYRPQLLRMQVSHDTLYSTGVLINTSAPRKTVSSLVKINYGNNYQLPPVWIFHIKYYVSNDLSDSWLIECWKALLWIDVDISQTFTEFSNSVWGCVAICSAIIELCCQLGLKQVKDKQR